MRISVVIPTHNRSKLLARAIESVLAQTRPADEIIVVDDGSTDDTAAVVSKHPTVSLIRKKNEGLSAARNTAIEASTSEWVVLLDDDDWFAPDLLDAQENAIRRHPDADLLYTGSRRVDGNENLLGFNLRSHRPPEEPLRALVLENFVQPSGTLLRKSALVRAGMFDENVRLCEDQDLWVRLAGMGCKFVYLPGCSVSITKHPGTMSSNSLLMAEATLELLIRRREWLASLERPGAKEQWLASAHYRLGRVLWDSGDLDRAATSFETACSLDASHRLASLYLWAVQRPMVIPIFRRARTFKRTIICFLQRLSVLETRWG